MTEEMTLVPVLSFQPLKEEEEKSGTGKVCTVNPGQGK